MPLKNKSEKIHKSPKIKKQATRSKKRENPKAAEPPRKRGVASERRGVGRVGYPDMYLKENHDRVLAGEYWDSKADKWVKHDSWVKSYDIMVGIINKNFSASVQKSNLEGVGDFWLSRLPKKITVYGSGPQYRIPEYNHPKTKTRVKWLEDSVAMLIGDNEDLANRIRGLEKTLSHLLNAFKK